MAAPRNRKHILVPGQPAAEKYTPHPQGGGGSKPSPPASRTEHGRSLERSFNAAIIEAHKRRDGAGIEVHGAAPGLYVQFESQPDVQLDVKSLESSRQGIEVVAFSQSHTAETKQRRIECATVFVPDGKENHFLTRFESYSKTTQRKKGERRYEDMIDRVAALQLATLRELWTDTDETYPEENETIWWEVWLRRQDGNELERLMEYASAKEIDVAPRRLMFNDRIVTLVRSAPAQLEASIYVLNDLAEVRKAQVVASEFDEMGPDDQGEWARELSDRVTPPPADAPAVCILDTGVTRGHLLLEASIAPEDTHAVDPTWGSHDNGGGPRMMGHGTAMAGLALYGDLAPLLASTQNIALLHRLESVKILPPASREENEPDLYGQITAEAVSRAEIQAPERRRTFSMSIASKDGRDRGQPTSWSAAIDALAAGRSFAPSTKGLDYLDEGDDSARRLFVLCAGNVDENALSVDHLVRSDTEQIHDPGQAWNALTVGAVTEMADIRDPNLANWKPVACRGELSPWSTTGVTFEDAWPIKPDVVFEGGNVVKNDSGDVNFPCSDLSLLSTYFKPADKAFVLSWATSAATAQAARLAALISAEYPAYWPETLRALIVHSAEWTEQMKTHLEAANGKRAKARLIKRYGFGVPSAERALRSANDALTLVAQGRIRPFTEGRMRELHFFDLPWPRDALAALGASQVRLRITLSYFIEPNPGRRGWKMRHRYASHSLYFDVKRATESKEMFRKRLNKEAIEGDEAKPATDSDSKRWYLGQEVRNRGSIHSDILSCNAIDLADRGAIAVYPVSGWWKDQPKRDRSGLGARYALIVSIETPGVETDIWTPVAQQVGVPVEIEV